MSEYKVISVYKNKPNDKGQIFYELSVLCPDGRVGICYSSTEFTVGDMVTFEPRIDLKTHRFSGVTVKRAF